MKQRRKLSKPHSKKQRRPRLPTDQNEGCVPKEPRAIVIGRGLRGTFLKRLKQELRSVFLPNTAQNMKERKFNKTRDFLEVCSPLGVTHVMALFSTDTSLNLKIIKTPQGPTVSFKVVSYALTTSVQKALRSSYDATTVFRSSPLLVMTNFQKSNHHQLLLTMLRGIFSSIDPRSMEIKNKKRVVLFDYDATEDCIRFRHYRISIPASGINKAVKSVIYGGAVPDLGDVDAISDFINKNAYPSVNPFLQNARVNAYQESEGEEAMESQVELASRIVERHGPVAHRVRLIEIGPRMDLSLHKIEQGSMDGLVLYNKFVKKSMEEIAATGRKREQTAQLKAMRRKEQEIRVEKKRKEREERRQRSKNAIPREAVEDDDDAAHYRQEVGLEPDAHFGIRRSTKKHRAGRGEESE